MSEETVRNKRLSDNAAEENNSTSSLLFQVFSPEHVLHGGDQI